MNTNRIAGNVAYGALFVAVIPALLVSWAGVGPRCHGAAAGRSARGDGPLRLLASAR